MHDGLAGNPPDIHRYVVAVGTAAGIYELLYPVDNVQDRDLLFPDGLEIIGKEQFLDDQQVSPAHRVPIEPCLHKIMIDDHRLCFNPNLWVNQV